MTDTDRLAAVLERIDDVYDIEEHLSHGGDYPSLAAAIIAADPTLICSDPDAHALAVLEQEFHPLRAIAAVAGPDGWSLTVEGWDLHGVIVYRSGKGQTLEAAITAALGDKG